MAVLVANPFGGHAAIEGRLEIRARLVGQAEGDEEDIGELFAQVFGFVAFFFGLLAVTACDDARHFAHFFRELGHVGQFIKVPNAKILDPLIDFGLQSLKGCCHVILCFCCPW